MYDSMRARKMPTDIRPIMAIKVPATSPAIPEIWKRIAPPGERKRE
jgi:hypothetical protein